MELRDTLRLMSLNGCSDREKRSLLNSVCGGCVVEEGYFLHSIYKKDNSAWIYFVFWRWCVYMVFWLTMFIYVNSYSQLCLSLCVWTILTLDYYNIYFLIRVGWSYWQLGQSLGETLRPKFPAYHQVMFSKTEIEKKNILTIDHDSGQIKLFG